MDKIIVKTSEEIDNVAFPLLADYGDLLNSPDSLSKINEAEGAYLESILGSNLKFMGGTLQTVGENPVLADLIEIPLGKPMMFLALVKTTETANGYKGNFKRIAAAKNSVGIVTFEQIQDIFTMRDQNYKVDFVADETMVQLRVWGLAGQTLDWTYSVVILNN